MAFRVRLLGPFSLQTSAGEALSVRSRKGQALIAILALAAGAPVPRDRLTALLWSDRGEDQARSSLRQALTALRKVFAASDSSALEITTEQVALSLETVAVDALRFAALADSADVSDVAVAAELYGGRLLDGLQIQDPQFETWLETERRRFARSFAEVLDSLLHLQEEAGQDRAAISTAERLLVEDPLNEAAHRALMRLYAKIGERNRALRQYQVCRDVLERELGVAPDRATQRLLDDLRRSNAAEPAETKSLRDGPEKVGIAVSRKGGEAWAIAGEKPGVAVLPFENLSGDPAQDYFADGMTAELITALSRFKRLFVIARNSSFTYKGRAVRVQEVGRQLGVHYVVEGSVMRAAERLRVSAQLVEAETGRHLWAERYDRCLDDVFALQDEVTSSIASTVGGRVDAAGIQRTFAIDGAAFRAYDHVLRGRAELLRFNKEANPRGREHLDKAMALDPGNARACASLALCHLIDWMAHWVEDRPSALARAYETARQALRLDESDSHAHWQLGEIHHYRREYEEARFHMERAIQLNPNDIEARGVYALLLAAVGEPEAALKEFEEAKRLDPFDYNWVPWLNGICCFSAGRYDEAISCLKGIEEPINEVRGWLAASLAQAGRVEEARATLDRFLRIAESDMAVFPGRALSDWEDYWHGAIEYENPADYEPLYAGLRKAGLE